jgi:hypothetical protein
MIRKPAQLTLNISSASAVATAPPGPGQRHAQTGHLGTVLDAGEGDPGKSVEAMSQYGGTVLKTSLSRQGEHETQDAVHGGWAGRAVVRIPHLRRNRNALTARAGGDLVVVEFCAQRCRDR